MLLFKKKGDQEVRAGYRHLFSTPNKRLFTAHANCTPCVPSSHMITLAKWTILTMHIARFVRVAQHKKGIMPKNWWLATEECYVGNFVRGIFLEVLKSEKTKIVRKLQQMIKQSNYTKLFVYGSYAICICIHTYIRGSLQSESKRHGGKLRAGSHEVPSPNFWGSRNH